MGDRPGLFSPEYIIRYHILFSKYRYRVMVMMFKCTFNNISAILWWTVPLVEETGVPIENHRPAASH
jgi:hypothetical protein